MAGQGRKWEEMGSERTVGGNHLLLMDEKEKETDGSFMLNYPTM